MFNIVVFFEYVGEYLRVYKKIIMEVIVFFGLFFLI